MQRSMIQSISRAVLSVLAIGALCVVGGAEVEANARDADGSRMQARAMKLGQTQKDTLMPPRDRVDWRSFKLDKAQSVSVSVKGKPASATVRVELTDSRGSSVQSTSFSGGSATLNADLEPGVYYVSVSASARVSYSISAR